MINIKGLNKAIKTFTQRITRKNKKSYMQLWAEKEVEIAKQRIMADCQGNDIDYDCGCCSSALKAFKSLIEDSHSGTSIMITKQLLNRLIDSKPLTPIEDTEDVWNDITEIQSNAGEKASYQCRRLSSLFKDVYPDGTVKYDDINRCYCVSIRNSGDTYHSNLVSRIFYELVPPITMPYYPKKAIAVYTDTFLTDKKYGDFDTVGIFYAIQPDNEKIQINRFFKASDDGWAEIDEHEYKIREKGRIDNYLTAGLAKGIKEFQYNDYETFLKIRLVKLLKTNGKMYWYKDAPLGTLYIDSRCSRRVLPYDFESIAKDLCCSSTDARRTINSLIDEKVLSNIIGTGDTVFITPNTFKGSEWPKWDKLTNDQMMTNIDYISEGGTLFMDTANASKTETLTLGEKILYTCDKRACDICNPECQGTTDVRHAKNFELRVDTYLEKNWRKIKQLLGKFGVAGEEPLANEYQPPNVLIVALCTTTF